MSLADDLYREIILEHFKNPRNHGHLERPDLTAQGANPFCGDELELTVALNGETIRDVRFLGKGCSISQASASMMTEVVKGKSLKAAEEAARIFKAMMLESAQVNFPPEMEDLESLEGVKKYPVRIKCAILSWNTLLDGIETFRKGGRQVKHVEGEEGAHPSLSEQSAAGQMPPAATTPLAQQPAMQKPGGGQENSEEQVRTTLKGVIDPELNMNVVDLGLIYGIDIKGNSVKVTYTLTSPGCPLGPVIKGQIHAVLSTLSWIKEVQPELVWAPPWDPRTMASEEVKTELGIW